MSLTVHQCGERRIEDVIATIQKYPLMNSYWEDNIADLE